MTHRSSVEATVARAGTDPSRAVSSRTPPKPIEVGSADLTGQPSPPPPPSSEAFGLMADDMDFGDPDLKMEPPRFATAPEFPNDRHDPARNGTEILFSPDSAADGWDLVSPPQGSVHSSMYTPSTTMKPSSRQSSSNATMSQIQCLLREHHPNRDASL